MKNHLHKNLDLGLDDIIGIHLDGNAFVFLADEENYANYLNDSPYDYYGTVVESSPFYMGVPFSGRWHLIIEQRGSGDSLDVRIEIQKQPLD